MTRHRMARTAGLSCGGLVLGLALPALAQNQSPTSSQAKPPGQAQGPASGAASSAQPRPDQMIIQALSANPITRPYGFTVRLKGGRYWVIGRVGTKVVHDVAVRTLTDLGVPFDDQITIDTSVVAIPANGPIAGQVGPMVGSRVGLTSYIYPPPLFGRYDDPFFGFEPPPISYPPWWRSIANRQPLNPNLLGPYGYPVPPVGSIAAPPRVQADVALVPAQYPDGSVPPPDGSAAGTQPPAGAPAATAGAQEGTVELTINPLGVATLRGTVPTLADRVAIGQRIAMTPGIAEVENLISVRDPNTPATPPVPQPPADASPKTGTIEPSPEPPPPPTPVPPTLANPPVNTLRDDGPRPPARPANPGVGDNDSALSDRLAQAIARRPALAGQPIKINARDGVAQLSGRVPTVYEAMLAFRAAQQTPGVREVADRLEFVVPDVETKNPLIKKGRPEDIEPYLEAQVRRQLGDLAHVDRVRVQGDQLSIKGTLVRADDRSRLEAILRSMPLLRGFKIEADFQPE